MLIDGHRRMPPPPLVIVPQLTRLQWWIDAHRRLLVQMSVGFACVMALLIGAQLWAAHEGFAGPLTSLCGDYFGTPESATMPWAGLGLALIGISARRRVIVLAAAAGIDLLFLTGRALDGARLTVGNGPTIVLTALALVAAVRWRGRQRRTALHAVALGAVLVLAAKVADTWLTITAISRPMVLDRFVQLSDRALGNPSWVMGDILRAAGPMLSGVLHWVYLELPAAAMVVAVWQLRHVTSSEWPRHYLVRTFLMLGLIGPIGYLLFPVVGPMFAFGSSGHGPQLGDYWPQRLPALGPSPEAIRFDRITPRNCMPSMHAAWALTIFIHSRRGPRLLRWGGTFWLVCTIAATLGFGYHYGSDLVAGAVLCLTVESALRDPDRGWDHTRIRLVAAGAVAFAALLLCYRYLAVSMAEYPVPFGILVLGILAAVSLAFYATWFAQPDTRPWGRCRAGSGVRRGGEKAPDYSTPAATAGD